MVLFAVINDVSDILSLELRQIRLRVNKHKKNVREAYFAHSR